MQKEIDLLSFLSRVTEKNTKHYRSDFLYDSRKLQEAAQAAAPEERCFFWMSRPSGTWCVLEREAFIRGSSAHNIWTHYADEPEGIVAYRVNVIEEKDGASAELPRTGAACSDSRDPCHIGDAAL